MKKVLWYFLISLIFIFPFIYDMYAFLVYFVLPIYIILKMVVLLCLKLKVQFWLPILFFDIFYFIALPFLNNYENEGLGSQSNLGVIVYYVYSGLLFFYLLKYRSKTFYPIERIEV